MLNAIQQPDSYNLPLFAGFIKLLILNIELLRSGLFHIVSVYPFTMITISYQYLSFYLFPDNEHASSLKYLRGVTSAAIDSPLARSPRLASSSPRCNRQSDQPAPPPALQPPFR